MRHLREEKARESGKGCVSFKRIGKYFSKKNILIEWQDQNRTRKELDYLSA